MFRRIIWAIGLLAVVAAGILYLNSYAHRCGPITRVEGELKTLVWALENYKTDFGIYPRNAATDALDSETNFDPANYGAASQCLYCALTGDSDRNPSTPSDGKMFIEFRPQQLKRDSAGTVISIVDPWGMSYGYSTRTVAVPSQTKSGNAFYNLWSTGGEKTERDRKKWIKNW